MIENNKTVDGIEIQNLKIFSKRKVIKVCDVCKIKIETKYSDVMKSRLQRKNELDYCKTCARKFYSGENNPAKRKEVREKISKAHLGKGKNFLNGFNNKLSLRKVDSRGYVQVYLPNEKKYIQEHRYIVEKVLGEKLKEHQIIHHIDGDKYNNSIQNLALLESNSEHSFVHSRLENLAMEMVKKNIFLYDKTRNDYFVNPNILFSEESLGFDDVSFKQKKNILKSRLDAKISSEFVRECYLDVPLLASNMDTVVNSDFCIKLSLQGALGVMHRVGSVDFLKAEVKKIANQHCKYVAASIGINDDDLLRNLVDCGANIIFIDIAHGYSDYVIEYGKKVKKEYPDIKLVMGNTINPEMMYEVDDFADAVKVGIAQGFACETANTAGCTEKQFSAVLKFKKISKQLGLPIVSDGALREPSHFVKSIAAGANSAMAGMIFARCPESAAEVELINDIQKKIYQGMASRAVQNRWKSGLKSGTCPEGSTKYLDIGESAENLLERYEGALRSGISYVGAKDIKTLQDNVEFVRLSK